MQEESQPLVPLPALRRLPPPCPDPQRIRSEGVRVCVVKKWNERPYLLARWSEAGHIDTPAGPVLSSDRSDLLAVVARLAEQSLGGKYNWNLNFSYLSSHPCPTGTVRTYYCLASDMTLPEALIRGPVERTAEAADCYDRWPSEAWPVGPTGHAWVDLTSVKKGLPWSDAFAHNCAQLRRLFPSLQQ